MQSKSRDWQTYIWLWIIHFAARGWWFWDWRWYVYDLNDYGDSYGEIENNDSDGPHNFSTDHTSIDTGTQSTPTEQKPLVFARHLTSLNQHLVATKSFFSRDKIEAYRSEIQSFQGSAANLFRLWRLTETDFAVASWFHRNQSLNVWCNQLCILFQLPNWQETDRDICKRKQLGQRCDHLHLSRFQNSPRVHSSFCDTFCTCHKSWQNRPLQQGLIVEPHLVHLDLEQKDKLLYFVPVSKARQWVQMQVSGPGSTTWDCLVC